LWAVGSGAASNTSGETTDAGPFRATDAFARHTAPSRYR